MKKISYGRMYNTETAKEVAKLTSNGIYSRSDFRWKEETLYLKKTGEFFIYGEGGPMTEYARHVDNGRMWGESIIPMTKFEAKRWVEKNCEADVYIELFGEVKE